MPLDKRSAPAQDKVLRKNRAKRVVTVSWWCLLRGLVWRGVDIPKCSMGLAYLPTKLCSFGGKWGTYTIHGEHLGYEVSIQIHVYTYRTQLYMYPVFEGVDLSTFHFMGQIFKNMGHLGSRYIYNSTVSTAPCPDTLWQSDFQPCHIAGMSQPFLFGLIVRKAGRYLCTVHVLVEVDASLGVTSGNLCFFSSEPPFQLINGSSWWLTNSF